MAKNKAKNSTAPRDLIGRYDCKLGCGALLTLPAEWLEYLGANRHVIALPDPEERCLRLIPAGNMELRLAKMRERALKDPAMNRALQVIGKVSEFVDVDADGRVGISTKLFEFVRITRQLMMIGTKWYAQLWCPEELVRYETK